MATKRAPRKRFQPKPDSGPKTCGCGCGGSPKGRFLPGHDAKLKGQLKREALGDDPEVASAAVKRLASLGWSWVLDTTPEQKAARKAALEAAKTVKEERKVERAEKPIRTKGITLSTGERIERGGRKTAEQINTEYKADFCELVVTYGRYGVPHAEVDRLQRRLLDDFTRLAA